jgi:hypothetical protein
LLRQLLPKKWLRGRAPRLSGTVDVVIPVYRGVAETRSCIESVLAAPTTTPREVIVIDDHSPEPELPPWLAGLAAGGASRSSPTRRIAVSS